MTNKRYDIKTEFLVNSKQISTTTKLFRFQFYAKWWAEQIVKRGLWVIEINVYTREPGAVLIPPCNIRKVSLTKL